MSSSSRGSHSSKETFLSAKVKRVALEQKLKFNGMIDEQKNVLNELKLQLKSSETLAKETVYKEAF